MTLEAVETRAPRGDAETLQRVVVLGAGPAGVGGALALARAAKAKVDVFEAGSEVGGAAGGFELDGIYCDYGSHRLHPAADPEVLGDVKAALGEDLLWRPRHGRIRLQGKWIHFPLKPMDFALNAPKPFVASVALDSALKPFKGAPKEETFASVLEKGLGPTICRSFYFPYARKLWGVEPEALDATAAHRRVSGSNVAKLIGKLLAQLPGFKRPTTGGFYYPRGGFRQICVGLQREAEKHGAQFHFGARVETVTIDNGRVSGVRVAHGGETVTAPADHVWSTIPITLLARMASPAAPAPVLEAANAIRYRSMILVYLVLGQDQYTEYDAHYFPETDIPMSRLSEPKNYSAATEPKGRTILCAELPCSTEDAVWSMSDAELGAQMASWLVTAGLPAPKTVLKALTRRLPQAYPIYDRDFEGKLKTLEDWVGGVEGLLTFGRQGLFAHDNTHHALAMAYEAERRLGKDGTWDKEGWARAREHFRSHVVED